jgi:hypothetical protein
MKGPRRMMELRFVRLIERHSQKLASELIEKLHASSRTAGLRKVPIEELRRRIQEILQHLSEWLLTKSANEIEKHFLETGVYRASQGVALSDICWAIILTKEHLWEFVERQGSMRGPIEIYGEMELLRLLDQFFDRGLCFATEGYQRYTLLQTGCGSP